MFSFNFSFIYTLSIDCFFCGTASIFFHYHKLCGAFLCKVKINFDTMANAGNNNDINELVKEVQIQLYITMAVGIIVVIILLILIIILFSIVERLKEEVRHKNEKKVKAIHAYDNSQFNGTPVGHTSREEIHLDEEMSRRGFRRYPSFSPSLVTCVETR